MKELWKDQVYIGFDTETTGRFPLVAEVVELAAVKWVNGKIVDQFESFVRPSQPMGEAVIRIHHITNEMVQDAPLMADVLPRFLEFIRGGILVAHHAPFDMGFLAPDFENLKLPLPENQVLCSCILSRRLFPRLMNHRLATLVQHFNIKVQSAHRALDDSRACLEAALKCMQSVGESASLDYIFKLHGGPLEWPRFSVQNLMENETHRVLVEGSRKKLPIEIKYEGGSRPGEPRRVTPLGLVRNPEGDYLVGLAHAENKEKRYYLAKISGAKILD